MNETGWSTQHALSVASGGRVPLTKQGHGQLVLVCLNRSLDGGQVEYISLSMRAPQALQPRSQRKEFRHGFSVLSL